MPPENKIPGYNAPMTTGQKLAVIGMILAALANILAALWWFFTL